MTAYVIVDIEVNDPIGYEKYKKPTPPVVKFFGGRFLGRAGPIETQVELSRICPGAGLSP